MTGDRKGKLKNQHKKDRIIKLARVMRVFLLQNEVDGG